TPPPRCSPSGRRSCAGSKPSATPSARCPCPPGWTRCSSAAPPPTRPSPTPPWRSPAPRTPTPQPGSGWPPRPPAAPSNRRCGTAASSSAPSGSAPTPLRVPPRPTGSRPRPPRPSPGRGTGSTTPRSGTGSRCAPTSPHRCGPRSPSATPARCARRPWPPCRRPPSPVTISVRPERPSPRRPARTATPPRRTPPRSPRASPPAPSRSGTRPTPRARGPRAHDDARAQEATAISARERARAELERIDADIARLRSALAGVLPGGEPVADDGGLFPVGGVDPAATGGAEPPAPADLEAALADLDRLGRAAEEAAEGVRAARRARDAAAAAVEELRTEVDEAAARLRAARDPLVPFGAPAPSDTDVLAGWTALVDWARAESDARDAALPAARAAVAEAEEQRDTAERAFRAAERAAA